MSAGDPQPDSAPLPELASARAGEEAARRFLAAVVGDEAAILKKALHAVAFPGEKMAFGG